MESEQALKVRGFYRVKLINPDGSVAGDSGEKENLITNAGFRYYLAYTLGAVAGSLQVSHAALGTGGVPNATDTALPGEVVKRAAVTAASSGSTSVQFTATFDSSASFVTDTKNISNIGLINSSNNGTLFSGNTFASSSCATNQTVNVTYRVTFA